MKSLPTTVTVETRMDLWSVVALLARIIVGSVMIFSGISKAAAPATEFAVVIESYQILSDTMALSMAAVLPWIEALAGLALVTGYLTRAASIIAGALLSTFIAALTSTMVRHIPLENCGCFGGKIHLTPLQAIGMDATLVLLCWLAFRKSCNLFSLDAWIDKGR